MPNVTTHVDQSASTFAARSQVVSTAAREGLNRWSRVVREAWANDDFKRRLLERPAVVLEEYGLKVPPGLDLRVVEDTDRVAYLTLPSDQMISGELTLDQLDGIVGGTAVEYAVMLALIIVVCITA